MGDMFVEKTPPSKVLKPRMGDTSLPGISGKLLASS